MNPVIGLDISKAESHGQAFVDRGKPFRGSFKFEHTRDGLTRLLRVAQEIESSCGLRPVLILEATGHYQVSPLDFCDIKP